MAKYPYILLPGSKATHRPYVQMGLGNPHNQKQTPRIRGLIDSGADVCLASKDIALWLGIQFDEKEGLRLFPNETITTLTAHSSQTGFKPNLDTIAE